MTSLFAQRMNAMDSNKSASKYSKGKGKPGKKLGFAKLHIAVGDQEVVTQLDVWSNNYRMPYAKELFKALLEYQKSDDFDKYITMDLLEIDFNLNENLESKVALYANCTFLDGDGDELTISFPIGFDRIWKRELAQLVEENPQSEFIPTADDCYIEWIAIDPKKSKKKKSYGFKFGK